MTEPIWKRLGLSDPDEFESRSIMRNRSGRVFLDVLE